jgi:hypothetical protein
MIQTFTVKIRQGKGLKVTPEAEQIDGKTFCFIQGWIIEEGMYTGEIAWYVRDDSYPLDAPIWLASGDLVPAEKAST